MARTAKTNRPADKEKKTAKKPAQKKQAVVVIHGMGEQRPMETLRSFVDTVWTKDLELTKARNESKAEQERQKNARTTDVRTEQTINKSWIVPDAGAGSHELRRITTVENKNGRRTDFFEFYWADVMQGTTLQHLLTWLKELLLRPPATVPRNVFGAWIVLIVLTAVTVVLAAVALISSDTVAQWLYNIAFQPIVDGRDFVCGAAAIAVLIVGAGRAWDGRPLAGVIVKTAFALLLIWTTYYVLGREVIQNHPRIWAIGASVVIGFIVHSFVVPTFGDVARYVRAAADTVEKRDLVRNRGLRLLNRLHDSGDYDRIIVVGHSLGSILAYDLVQLLWAERAPDPDNPPTDEAVAAFQTIDEYVRRRNESWSDNVELREFRAAQCALGCFMQSCQKPWLISDFVTVGSPLTHAEFLMARDKSELTEFIRDRLLSKSPPEPDETPYRGDETILYKGRARTPRFPHHAAVFAATRWTNIHDPNSLIFFGDMISGSLTENFGQGIEEYEVEIVRPFLFGLTWRFFTHTFYWKWRDSYLVDGVPEHIADLRSAVALDES